MLGGVIVKSAFFFPPSCFRNPSSLMLTVALEPGQRKGGRKRRRGIVKPYAIWFSACLTDSCSFIWPESQMTVLFRRNTVDILSPHTRLFELCFQNECRNSHESNPNCFVSLFKWFCQWMAPWHQSSQWCIQIDAHPITDSSELLPFNHELFYFPDFTLPSFRNTYEQKQPDVTDGVIDCASVQGLFCN